MDPCGAYCSTRRDKSDIWETMRDQYESKTAALLAKEKELKERITQMESLLSSKMSESCCCSTEHDSNVPKVFPKKFDSPVRDIPLFCDDQPLSCVSVHASSDPTYSRRDVTRPSQSFRKTSPIRSSCRSSTRPQSRSPARSQSPKKMPSNASPTFFQKVMENAKSILTLKCSSMQPALDEHPTRECAATFPSPQKKSNCSCEYIDEESTRMDCTDSYSQDITNSIDCKTYPLDSMSTIKSKKTASVVVNTCSYCNTSTSTDLRVVMDDGSQYTNMPVDCSVETCQAIKMDSCWVCPSLSTMKKCPNRSSKKMQSCTNQTCASFLSINRRLSTPTVTFKCDDIDTKPRSKSQIKEVDIQCAFIGSPMFNTTECTAQKIIVPQASQESKKICQCCPYKRTNHLQQRQDLASISDLTTKEREIKGQMEHLQSREKNYDALYSSYQNMISNAPSCCCSTPKGQIDKIDKVSHELRLENKVLKDELMQMKMDLKHCLEKVEGPLKSQLETEKMRCLKLERDLSAASQNMMMSQDAHLREMNTMKIQLCMACSNINELNSLNRRLKEEMSSLDDMCTKLEDDLMKQKISEAETIKLLTKRRGEQYEGMCTCHQTGVEDKSSCDSNLHVIARKLSKTLKESEPCEECAKLPAELTGAAKCIKDLSDLVESRKVKKAEPEESISKSSKEGSVKVASSQAPPETMEEGSQCMEGQRGDEAKTSTLMAPVLLEEHPSSEMEMKTSGSAPLDVGKRPQVESTFFSAAGEPMSVPKIQERPSVKETKTEPVEKETALEGKRASKMSKASEESKKDQIKSDRPSRVSKPDEDAKKPPAEDVKSGLAESDVIKSVEIPVGGTWAPQPCESICGSEEPCATGEPCFIIKGREGHPEVKMERLSTTAPSISIRGGIIKPIISETLEGVMRTKYPSSAIIEPPEQVPSKITEEVEVLEQSLIMEEPTEVTRTTIEIEESKPKMSDIITELISGVEVSDMPPESSTEKLSEEPIALVTEPATTEEKSGDTSAAFVSEAEPPHQPTPLETSPPVMQEPSIASQASAAGGPIALEPGVGPSALEEPLAKPPSTSAQPSVSPSVAAPPSVTKEPSVSVKRSVDEEYPITPQVSPKSEPSTPEQPTVGMETRALEEPSILTMQKEEPSIPPQISAAKAPSIKESPKEIVPITPATPISETKAQEESFTPEPPSPSVQPPVAAIISAPTPPPLTIDQTQIVVEPPVAASALAKPAFDERQIMITPPSVTSSSTREPPIFAPDRPYMEERTGNFPFDVDTKVEILDVPPADLHVTTTITASGTLEVITEGPEGVIETTLIYQPDGTIQVVTQVTEEESGTREDKPSTIKIDPEAFMRDPQKKGFGTTQGRPEQESFISGATELTGLETVTESTKETTFISSSFPSDFDKTGAPDSTIVDISAAADLEDIYGQPGTEKYYGPGGAASGPEMPYGPGGAGADGIGPGGVVTSLGSGYPGLVGAIASGPGVVGVDAQMAAGLVGVGAGSGFSYGPGGVGAGSIVSGGRSGGMGAGSGFSYGQGGIGAGSLVSGPGVVGVGSGMAYGPSGVGAIPGGVSVGSAMSAGPGEVGVGSAMSAGPGGVGVGSAMSAGPGGVGVGSALSAGPGGVGVGSAISAGLGGMGVASAMAGGPDGVDVGSAMSAGPGGVGVGSVMSAGPGGVGIGSAMSAGPGGAGVGSAMSANLGGMGVGPVMSAGPGGVGVGSAMSAGPGGVGVGSAMSAVPRGVGVGSAMSADPGGVGVGSAMPAGPGEVSVGSAMSTGHGGVGVGSIMSAGPGGMGVGSAMSAGLGGMGVGSAMSAGLGGMGVGPVVPAGPGGVGVGPVMSAGLSGVGVGSAMSAGPGGVGVGSAVSAGPGGMGVGSAMSAGLGGMGVGPVTPAGPGGVGVGSAMSAGPGGVGVGSMMSAGPGRVGVGSIKSATPRGVGVESAISAAPGGVGVGTAMSVGPGGMDISGISERGEEETTSRLTTGTTTKEITEEDTTSRHTTTDTTSRHTTTGTVTKEWRDEDTTSRHTTTGTVTKECCDEDAISRTDAGVSIHECCDEAASHLQEDGSSTYLECCQEDEPTDTKQSATISAKISTKKTAEELMKSISGEMEMRHLDLTRKTPGTSAMHSMRSGVPSMAGKSGEKVATDSKTAQQALRDQKRDCGCQATPQAEQSCQCCECKDVGISTSKDSETLTDENMVQAKILTPVVKLPDITEPEADAELAGVTTEVSRTSQDYAEAIDVEFGGVQGTTDEVSTIHEGPSSIREHESSREREDKEKGKSIQGQDKEGSDYRNKKGQPVQDISTECACSDENEEFATEERAAQCECFGPIERDVRSEGKVSSLSDPARGGSFKKPTKEMEPVKSKADDFDKISARSKPSGHRSTTENFPDSDKKLSSITTDYRKSKDPEVDVKSSIRFDESKTSKVPDTDKNMPFSATDSKRSRSPDVDIRPSPGVTDSKRSKVTDTNMMAPSETDSKKKKQRPSAQKLQGIQCTCGDVCKCITCSPKIIAERRALNQCPGALAAENERLYWCTPPPQQTVQTQVSKSSRQTPASYVKDSPDQREKHPPNCLCVNCLCEPCSPCPPQYAQEEFLRSTNLTSSQGMNYKDKKRMSVDDVFQPPEERVPECRVRDECLRFDPNNLPPFDCLKNKKIHPRNCECVDCLCLPDIKRIAELKEHPIIRDEKQVYQVKCYCENTRKPISSSRIPIATNSAMGPPKAKSVVSCTCDECQCSPCSDVNQSANKISKSSKSPDASTNVNNPHQIIMTPSELAKLCDCQDCQCIVCFDKPPKKEAVTPSVAPSATDKPKPKGQNKNCCCKDECICESCPVEQVVKQASKFAPSPSAVPSVTPSSAAPPVPGSGPSRGMTPAVSQMSKGPQPIEQNVDCDCEDCFCSHSKARSGATFLPDYSEECDCEDCFCHHAKIRYADIREGTNIMPMKFSKLSATSKMTAMTAPIQAKTSGIPVKTSSVPPKTSSIAPKISSVAPKISSFGARTSRPKVPGCTCGNCICPGKEAALEATGDKSRVLSDCHCPICSCPGKEILKSVTPLDQSASMPPIPEGPLIADCDCIDCQCNPCADPKRRKPVLIAPCDCVDCKCDPCADPAKRKDKGDTPETAGTNVPVTPSRDAGALTASAVISGDKGVMVTQSNYAPAPTASAGVGTTENRAVHPPDCICNECLCHPDDSHESGCNCLECKCTDCFWKRTTTGVHAEGCMCTDCLCKPCKEKSQPRTMPPATTESGSGEANISQSAPKQSSCLCGDCKCVDCFNKPKAEKQCVCAECLCVDCQKKGIEGTDVEKKYTEKSADAAIQPGPITHSCHCIKCMCEVCTATPSSQEEKLKGCTCEVCQCSDCGNMRAAPSTTGKRCTCTPCQCEDCLDKNREEITAGGPLLVTTVPSIAKPGTVSVGSPLTDPPPFEVPIRKPCDCRRCECSDCNKMGVTASQVPPSVSFAGNVPAPTSVTASIAANIATSQTASIRQTGGAPKTCTCGIDSCIECKTQGTNMPPSTSFGGSAVVKIDALTSFTTPGPLNTATMTTSNICICGECDCTECTKQGMPLGMSTSFGAPPLPSVHSAAGAPWISSVHSAAVGVPSVHSAAGVPPVQSIHSAAGAPPLPSIHSTAGALSSIRSAAGAPCVQSIHSAAGAPPLPSVHSAAGAPYIQSIHSTAGAPCQPSIHSAAGAPPLPSIHSAAGALYQPSIHSAAGAPPLPSIHSAAGAPPVPSIHSTAGAPCIQSIHSAAGVVMVPSVHSTHPQPSIHSAAGAPCQPSIHSAAGAPYQPSIHSAAGAPCQPSIHSAAGTPYQPSIHSAVVAIQVPSVHSTRPQPSIHSAAGAPCQPSIHSTAGAPPLPSIHSAAGAPPLPSIHSAAGTPYQPSIHSAAGAPCQPSIHSAAGAPPLPSIHSAAGAPPLPSIHSAAGAPYQPSIHSTAGAPCQPSIHSAAGAPCQPSIHSAAGAPPLPSIHSAAGAPPLPSIHSCAGAPPLPSIHSAAGAPYQPSIHSTAGAPCQPSIHSAAGAPPLPSIHSTAGAPPLPSIHSTAGAPCQPSIHSAAGAPPLPSIHSTAGAPPLPSIHSTAGAPCQPSIHSAAGAPPLPSIHSAAGAPPLPSIHSTAGAPPLPSIHSAAGAPYQPSIHSTAGAPCQPSIHSAAGAPPLPSVHSAAGAPPLPSIPSAPGVVMVSSVHSTRPQPSIHSAAGAPCQPSIHSAAGAPPLPSIHSAAGALPLPSIHSAAGAPPLPSIHSAAGALPPPSIHSAAGVVTVPSVHSTHPQPSINSASDAPCHPSSAPCQPAGALPTIFSGIVPQPQPPFDGSQVGSIHSTQPQAKTTMTKCICPTCTCPETIAKDAIISAPLMGIPAVVSKSTGIITTEMAHTVGCTCADCCTCAAKAQPTSINEELINISKMDNETLMKKIQTDKQENCKCREQIKEIKRALDKIKCSCTEAEMKAIRSGTASGKPFVKQASAFGQTMSGLKFALNNLQDKCKAKDRLIEVMTGELKMRTSSYTFDKVLNISSKEDAPDYDRAEDVKSFERSPENTTNILYSVNEEREIGQTNLKKRSSEFSGHKHKKKFKSCKCGKQHKDRDNSNVDLSGFEVVDIRRITQDSIIIKWKPPQSSVITGYDIFVNGVNKSKVMSGGRTSAMVHSLDLSSTIQITIYAVTKCGRCEPPAIAIYEINT